MLCSSEKLDVNNNDKFWNPMEVRWTEEYDEKINHIWNKLPEKIQPVIITLTVFILGISIRGEWFIFAVHCIKHYSSSYGLLDDNTDRPEVFTATFFKDFILIWPISNILSYSLYFLLGGFLHWFYYVKQRDQPEKWKCQPDRWLSPELELDEIFYGSISLVVTNTYSTLLTCYVRNGGRTRIYHQFDEYSWTWWILQWPFIFLLQDYMVYCMHRLYHTPFLYKHFHKLHHKYKQPTAFSVTAIHPLEILHIQFVVTLPIFFIPYHWLPYYGVAFYTYYNGIIDHSGIDFKASWWQPWRPDVIFHDNHHQYFHVNFSLNTYIWDYIHGTYRRNDRIYNENIFYGKGKPLSEATSKEMEMEKEERRAENPRAHRKASSYKLPVRN